MGIPPNGMSGPGTTGMSIGHVVDGMEVESWNAWDVLGLMQWLGVVTPPRPLENYLWGDPSDVTGDPGDPETNTDLILQYVEEVWNGRNVDFIDEIVSPAPHASGYVLRFHYFLQFDDLKGEVALLVLQSHVLGLVQYFQTLFVEPFIIENRCKIKLFPDLYLNVLMNWIEFQAHQYLPV